MDTRDTLTMLADKAAAYCDAVENASTLGREQFFPLCHRLLVELYGAALSLNATDESGQTEAEEAFSVGIPADESNEVLAFNGLPYRKRSVLANRVKECAGEFNYYRKVFDPFEELGEVVICSLSLPKTPSKHE